EFMKTIHLLPILLLGLLSVLPLHAEDAPRFISAAVLDFNASGEADEVLGREASNLIAVSLTLEDDIVLVERAELKKILGEQQLGLSGAVNTATAAKVGELTGAKVLVTGRIINVGGTKIVVAKVIGTETSRV